MNRVERLINLIAALLDSPAPMTAEQIRTQIAGYDNPNEEAFRRAFERDKADLKAIGIPIELVEDPWGGAPSYTIPKERYYLPDLDLAPDELAALRIAANAVLGSQGAAGSGLLKLTAAGPDVPWTGARLTWNADIAATEPLLSPLYEAIADRRVVSFTYHSAGSAEARIRRVEPFALVHRRGHWYLIGRERELDETRTFKLSRMTPPIETHDERFVPPAHLDPEQHVGGDSWIAGDDTINARVRFSEPVAWWARQSFPSERVSRGPGGAVDVTFPVASLDALSSFVAWWGTDVEVLEPPEARHHLAARLRSLIAS
ncbi:MAG: WYL domain-containing protein [Actinomycetota bacterium]|nr:WYL domain-containing protein [Actinomycetota bacterium]